MKRLFTSESVTQGHPDKLCDLISDSILDEYLKKDENARVACEVLAGKGEIIVSGEISSSVKIDIESIVRNTVKKIGYDNEQTDINYNTCIVHINISKQSPDIAIGIDKSIEAKMGKTNNMQGAGDQGMMFGFACNETKELMPLPISLAHKLTQKIDLVRKEKLIDYIRPDGKAQVTVEYKKGKPVRVDTIVISVQHNNNISITKLRKDIKEKVVYRTIPKELLDKKTKYFINPTGRFVIGGPLGDTGLTGRKIILDTYGGYSKHGGGAFSGKDATKIDRAGAYMARFIAKNVVANRLANICEIQLSYAIGVANPISICVDTFGTGIISENKIMEKILKNFNLTPNGIIKTLDLKKPIYTKTTNYGHFGKEYLPWEKIINLK